MAVPQVWTTEMSDVVVDDRADGVRVVRLNRPEKLNALTPDMVDAVTAAMQVERSHRAVLITGQGRGFCAGVDIAGAHERQQGRSNADAYAMQERFAGMTLAVTRAPVPVVAAVNGPAAGAGFALALSCDIRLAARSAKFLVGAPRIGLSAGECGISYFLPRLIGVGRAAEIMFTNRPVTADEAERIGLVTVPLRRRRPRGGRRDHGGAGGCAQPFGQKMTKQLYRANADAGYLEAALQIENRAQILANATEDAAEARAAFLEKRPPVFTGR